MRHLLPIFQWFDKSWVGTTIADSSWLFPAIEAVHIVALALLLGALLVLNLRLLGVRLTDKPVVQLARELSPWVFCSLVIILASGVLLFASEALKSYGSAPFQFKMVLLFSAIIFHYTLYGRVTRADETRISPVWSKLSAIVSILLWTGVGAAGRAIGFL